VAMADVSTSTASQGPTSAPVRPGNAASEALTGYTCSMTDADPDATAPRGSSTRTWRVHPTVDRLGAYSWRLIGIGIVALAAAWVLRQLWVVVLALAVAVLFSRALDPVAARLRRRGWRPGLVAISVMLGFALLIAGIVAALVPPIASEFDDLGPTIEDAVDDVEDWLVEDSPFDVSRRDIEDFRDGLDERVDQLTSQSGASSRVVDTTLVVVEVAAALLLAVITSFFMLKDGDRFGRWVLTLLPAERRTLVSRLSTRAWQTLGGYLRGAAMLGILEGAIIGLTLWIVGGRLAVPVAVITFFAAFVPFVGAIVAGAIAVMVALVTAGFGGAVVVLVVAVAVQQLDNDLLAPVVYGRQLNLHPLVVLFAITSGSALLGVAGAFFAVPVTAVVINVLAEARRVAVEGRDTPQALPSATEAGPAASDVPPA
jgi:predicted PurR-regulated permease PerM